MMMKLLLLSSLGLLCSLCSAAKVAYISSFVRVSEGCAGWIPIVEVGCEGGGNFDLLNTRSSLRHQPTCVQHPTKGASYASCSFKTLPQDAIIVGSVVVLEVGFSCEGAIDQLIGTATLRAERQIVCKTSESRQTSFASIEHVTTDGKRVEDFTCNSGAFRTLSTSQRSGCVSSNACTADTPCFVPGAIARQRTPLPSEAISGSIVPRVRTPLHRSTLVPTRRSLQVTDQPTPDTFVAPTMSPTKRATLTPTRAPTTLAPTRTPTKSPTRTPTESPTRFPTRTPTRSPTQYPTEQPTYFPTYAPSASPSSSPTSSPTNTPSFSPSGAPTAQPSESPTSNPTASPSMAPSDQPSFQPTMGPTVRGRMTFFDIIQTARSRAGENPMLVGLSLGGTMGLIVAVVAGSIYWRLRGLKGRVLPVTDNDDDSRPYDPLPEQSIVSSLAADPVFEAPVSL